MLPGDPDRAFPLFGIVTDLEIFLSKGLSAVIAELEQDSVADEEVNQTIKRYAPLMRSLHRRCWRRT